MARQRSVEFPRRKAEFIQPMECALVPNLPEGPDWTYEVKLDGYRAIGVKANREAILYSRNQKNFSKRFPQIAEALGDLPATQKLLFDAFWFVFAAVEIVSFCGACYSLFIPRTKEDKMRGFVWLGLGVLLFLAWAISFFVFHVTGVLIHLLLVFALISFMIYVFTGKGGVE